jgi:hypothetical protein
MPNLKPWIEAQLKKGYTKQQIKRVLNRRGYPKTAVAHVDKANTNKTSYEKTNKHRKSKRSIVVILIVILIFAYLALKILYNTQVQPPQQIIEHLNFEEFSGTLVELNNNEFILDTDGQTFTLTHEGLADDANIIKILQDGTIIDSSIEELNQGDIVTIAVEVQDDKRVVRAIAIEDLP